MYHGEERSNMGEHPGKNDNTKQIKNGKMNQK